MGKGREMRMKRHFAWSDEHTMQCLDDVALSCTFETCMVLWISATSINSIKYLDIKYLANPNDNAWIKEKESYEGMHTSTLLK